MNKIQQMVHDLCPNGVEWKTLGEVTISLKKATLVQSALISIGEYPVINSGRDLYGKYDKYNNQGNAFVIAARGEYAGFVNYMPSKFWAGGLCYPYRSKAEEVLTTKFIFYYLKSQENTIRETLVTRGSIPAINKQDVEQIPIPIPPLSIQVEIVNLLDKFTQLSAELKLRRKQYDYYRNHLLSFDSNSTIVQWMPLGEVAELKAGKSIAASQIFASHSIEHQYPCFGGNGIRGYVDSFSHQGEFPIIGRQGALCGCVNYAKRDFYATEHAVVAKPKGDIISLFLFYMLQNANLNQYKTQGAQPGLSVIKLNDIVFPIPPIEEQERIVNFFDKFETFGQRFEQGLACRDCPRAKTIRILSKLATHLRIA